MFTADRLLKNKKRSNKAGFTVVELVVTLALSAVVLIICARLFFSAGSIASLTSYFNSQEVQTRYTAEMINNAIKYTNALFTIPQSSFTEANLTESWSYLGVMDDVTIPKGLIEEREGKTVADTLGNDFKTTALVYIKYIGADADVDEESVTASLSSDQSLIHNDDGYFIMTVFDYEHFNNKLGYSTKYELVFNTTNDEESSNVISDSIKYSLKVTYYDKLNNVVGQGSNIDLETMLNGINMLQAVYQGSASDPATAIAFHEDAFNVSVKKGAPIANIVFVLDLSGSMNDRMNSGKTRVQVLKENVINFLNQFKDYNTVYISFVQYSTFGISAVMPAKAKDNYSSLFDYANLLTKKTGGGTNTGDGIRIAYSHFKYIYDNNLNPGASNYLIVITDGYVNGWSVDTPSAMETDITGYNNVAQQYNDKYGSKISLLTHFSMPTYDESKKYYWDVANLSGKPKYVLYYYESSKLFGIPANSSNLNSLNIGGTYMINKNNGKYYYDFTYTAPTGSQLDGLAMGYINYVANQFKTANFKMPSLNYVTISDFTGSKEQSEAIMNAFSTTTNYTKNYAYSVNDEASFIDCISTLAADITTSAWLLDGPKT